MTRGVHTLEDLKARCVVDDVTGCWKWRMAVSGGAAMVYLPALGKTRTGLFAALILSGRALKPGQRAFGTCGTQFCVCPAHVKALTSAQWGKGVAASGAWKGNPARVVANRATAKTRPGTVLTEGLAQEIRASAGTGREIARRFGISDKQVSRIRCGTTWAPRALPNASVFDWAANAVNKREAA